MPTASPTDPTPLATPPAALAFSPEGGELVSPAYSLAFKGLALLLLAAAAAWAWQMHRWNLQQTEAQHPFWLWAPWALMAYTVGFVILGTTRLNAEGIEQSWMWRKRVDLKDLAYAKVVRLRGLEWLIAPRLYTRTFQNKIFVFYAASPRMLDEFKRLELALAALRTPT